MKKIVLPLLLLILSACHRNNPSVNLEMQCNNLSTNLEVKENDTLSCNLLGENYEFKVTKLDEDKIILESNKYGLTSSSSLIEKEKEFTLTKNSSITLTTQSTDYQEKVIFNWK